MSLEPQSPAVVMLDVEATIESLGRNARFFRQTIMPSNVDELVGHKHPALDVHQ